MQQLFSEMNIKADNTACYSESLFLFIYPPASLLLNKKSYCALTEVTLFKASRSHSSAENLILNYGLTREKAGFSFEQTKRRDVFLFYLFLFCFGILKRFPHRDNIRVGHVFSKSNIFFFLSENIFKHVTICELKAFI